MDKQKNICFEDIKSNSNTLILGATGSGKTTQVLLPFIHEDFKEMNKNLIVIEPSGNFTKQVKKMSDYYDIHYTEYNTIENLKINLFLGDEKNVVENILILFQSMMNENEKINEDFLIKTTKILKRTFGNNITINNFKKFVLNLDGYTQSVLEELQTKHPIDINQELIKNFKNAYLNENTNEFKYCRSLKDKIRILSENKYIKSICNFEKEEDCFNFADHKTENKVVLFSMKEKELGNVARFLTMVLNLQLTDYILNKKDNKKYHIYIDEFKLNKNDEYQNKIYCLLKESENLNTYIYLATQNLNEFKHDEIGEIVNNFIILPSTDVNLFFNDLLTKEDRKQIHKNKFGQFAYLQDNQKYLIVDSMKFEKNLSDFLFNN